MTPLQLTRSVRSLNRLRQIAMVLTRHGFGHIVAQVNLTRYLPVWMLRKKVRGASIEEGPSSIGRRIALVCGELGPTFIKFGQVLSTRPDIVPGEVAQELKRLQDDVPPFDTQEAMQTIEEELGQPVSECYAQIDPKPFASASIGQVYHARLKDGTPVVVKVRRPDIEDVVRLDMHLMHWMAKTLEDFMPEIRIYRPAMLVDELEETLLREIDYVNEASATSRFAEALGDDTGLRIPQVYWDLSGPRVLTLEAITGKNLEKAMDRSQESGRAMDRRLVARRIADCHMRQVFELGVFHADPHPGNLLIDPPARVGWIDFGQVGTIGDELLTDLIVLVYACVNDEMEVVIDTLADMGALGRETDRRMLHRALEVLIHKYYGLPMKRFDLGAIFNEFSDVMRRHDVVVPRDLAMLIKASGTVGGLVAKLDPELDILELVKPRLHAAMKEKLSPSSISRRSALMTWDLLSIIRKAPRQLRSVLRRLSTKGWELRVRHDNIEPLTRELDRSSNRIAFSVVIAAIIVGSSMVFSAGSTIVLFGIPVYYFGIVGFLLAGVLGLGLSWAIFRSGRLH
jgi:ubiquinone biosynthesis protein